ncbi:MAG: cytochrome c [Sinobacteraceae bacterium]|nr:cytochrome c [Nevskiaceae bacterium]
MKHLAMTVLLLPIFTGAGGIARAGEMSGKQVFDHYCSYCHGAAEGPGSTQLARTRGADKALLTERRDLQAKYVEYVVRHGLRAMPPFVPSDLTDARLKALADFLAR